MVHQRSSENDKRDQSNFQPSEGVHARNCIQASIPPSPAELYPRADKGLAQGHTKVTQLVEPRSSKTEGLILLSGQEFLSCFLLLDCRVLSSLTWSGQCPAAFFLMALPPHPQPPATAAPGVERGPTLGVSPGCVTLAAWSSCLQPGFCPEAETTEVQGLAQGQPKVSGRSGLGTLVSNHRPVACLLRSLQL